MRDNKDFQRAEAAALRQPEPSDEEQRLIEQFAEQFAELEHNEEVIDFLLDYPDQLIDFFVATRRGETNEAQRIYDHLEAAFIEYRFMSTDSSGV